MSFFFMNTTVINNPLLNLQLITPIKAFGLISRSPSKKPIRKAMNASSRHWQLGFRGAPGMTWFHAAHRAHSTAILFRCSTIFGDHLQRAYFILPLVHACMHKLGADVANIYIQKLYTWTLAMFSGCSTLLLQLSPVGTLTSTLVPYGSTLNPDGFHVTSWVLKVQTWRPLK